MASDKSMMLDNGEYASLTDAELHAELQKLDPTYKESGKLNEVQRSIKIKKLHHLQAKERKEQEARVKKEKQEQKEAAKNAPPPEKKTRGGKRKSVMPNATLPLPFSLERPELRPVADSVLEVPDKARTTPKKLSSPEVISNCVTLSVTDSNLGSPASALRLTLYGFDTNNDWKVLAQRATNENGECPGLITRDLFLRGIYRLHLDTDEYFRRQNAASFYPYVDIVFNIVDPTQHQHLTVMIGPHGYSTYKSS